MKTGSKTFLFLLAAGLMLVALAGCGSHVM
jgi:LPXTG-motif cell wall-anchored protein